MKFSGLLLATGIALTAVPAQAAPIVYQGSDTEGSVKVSYVITTDGALGTLALTDILSSAITFQGTASSGLYSFGPFTAYNNLYFQNTNAGGVSPVSATATNLFFDFAGGGGLNMSAYSYNMIFNGTNGGSVVVTGNAAPSGLEGLVFALAPLMGTDYDSVVYHDASALPDKEIDLVDPNYSLQPGTYTTVLPTIQVIASVGAAAVVPEPSSWALVILGLAGMSFAARRRLRPAIARARTTFA